MAGKPPNREALEHYRDQIADINYRIDTGVLLGFRAIDHDRTKLSFELGPGYAWEEQGGRRSEFVTVRLAQRFEYQFSRTSKVWQSSAWHPRADDLSDSIVEFEAGLETRITRQWSLRSNLRFRFDDTPAAGSDRNDTALVLGLAYNLNGLSSGVTAALMPSLARMRRNRSPNADLD